MDSIELTLTAVVLDLAKQIREREIPETDLEPPALGLYIERAIKDLAAWHPFVIEAVQNLQKEGFFSDDLPPQ